VASFLDARAVGGRWLVRMEDLDRPRCEPGMADTILRQLEAYGLHWDDDVLVQSQRDDAYAAALDALKALGAVYPAPALAASLRRRRATTRATSSTPAPAGRGCRRGRAHAPGAFVCRM